MSASGMPALALESERVLILAANAEALGDFLAGFAHRLEGEHGLHARVRKAPAKRRVPGGLGAARERVLGLPRDERRARHRLGAARDEELPVAGAHGMTGAHDRREARGAQPVHRDAGHLLGQTGEQRGHARDVAVILPRLIRGAEIDVLDLTRRHSGALDRFTDDEGREIVGPLFSERAAVAADRGANG